MPPLPDSDVRLQGKTVIYGGSFDPPHMSHQISCLYLLEALGAHAVWMLPSATHPFGKVLTPYAARHAMCKCLAAPFAGRVVVMRTEEDLGGAGRTYDTLVHLKAEYPEREFVLAIGADIVADTPRWHRWPDIEAMLPVVVVGRSGYTARGAPLELPSLSSTQVRSLCRRGGSILGLVPEHVAAYIEAHGLYRG